MTPRQREVVNLLNAFSSRNLRAGLDSHNLVVQRQAWATEATVVARILEIVESDRPACPPCVPSLTTMAMALVAGLVAAPIVWLATRRRR